MKKLLATDTHRLEPTNLRKSAEPLELFLVVQTNCALGTLRFGRTTPHGKVLDLIRDTFRN